MAKKIEFKDIKINDIVNWCKANNQIEWLKEECAKTTTVERYPRIKVWDEKKQKYVSKADKTQKPTYEEVPITFVEVKRDFMATFFPEEVVGKQKKPTFHERIANL